MWQRVMPNQPGVYWTRANNWDVVGLLTVASLPSGALFCPQHPVRGLDHVLVEGTSWKGWWWSEPISECPPIPGPDEAVVEDGSIYYCNCNDADLPITRQCPVHDA